MNPLEIICLLIGLAHVTTAGFLQSPYPYIVNPGAPITSAASPFVHGFGAPLVSPIVNFYHHQPLLKYFQPVFYHQPPQFFNLPAPQFYTLPETTPTSAPAAPAYGLPKEEEEQKAAEPQPPVYGPPTPTSSASDDQYQDSYPSGFNNQGNRFQSGPSGFNNQGNRFQSGPSDFNNQGNPFSSRPSGFNNQGNRFSSRPSNYYNPGNRFSSGPSGFNRQGNRFSSGPSDFTYPEQGNRFSSPFSSSSSPNLQVYEDDFRGDKESVIVDADRARGPRAPPSNDDFQSFIVNSRDNSVRDGQERRPFSSQPFSGRGGYPN